MRSKIFILTLMIAASSESFAGDSMKLVDLSAGVAIPSNNDSVLLNPAALGAYDDRVGEIALYTNGTRPEQGTVGYAHGFGVLGLKAGLGFTLLKDRDSALAAGGLGVGIGPVQAGVTGRFGIESSSTGLDAGIRYASSSGLVFGATVPDIQYLQKRWRVGLAKQWSSGITFEADFLSSHRDIDQLLEPNSISGTLALGFLTEQKFSLIGGIRYDLYPNPSSGLHRLFAGGSIWAGDHIAAFAHYQHEDAEYVVGIKFR